MSKFKEYSLTKTTEELRKLILENPDLPIAVLAGEDANIGNGYWMFCSRISFSIGEILDCDYYDYGDTVFTERERLEEFIADELYDEYHDKPLEEYEDAIIREVEMYEPYWKKVIMIWADN